MERKEFLKQVEETFKSNENADKLYVTSDGMCFPLEGPARNHSRMLGPHGGVECITRESLVRLASGKPATGKPKAEENTNAGEGGNENTNAGEGGENGGGAAAGEGTAGTEGGQPGQQAAATAKKEAPKKVATKKAATKKTATKKK